MPSSFRDPAGYVVCDNGVFKRVITPRGRADYELYVSSGLHRNLAGRGLVLEHEEEGTDLSNREPGTYKAIRPEQLPFISYPYEWSFDELKDAALLTLEVQETALGHGLSLKDASAFNVQFRGARAVFIDLLSFERDRGGPWIAYEQFCRHFLGPLLLMQYGPAELNRCTMTDLAGLRLDTIAGLLPARSYLDPDALIHIHFQALMQRKKGGGRGPWNQPGQPNQVKRTLVRSLRAAVERLRPWKHRSRRSGDCEPQGHWIPEAEEFTAAAVRSLVRRLRPGLALDIGANTGKYTNQALDSGGYWVAADPDPVRVNRLYLEARKAGSGRLLPLVVDILNPSPGVGFDLRERASFAERARVDLVMLLGALHHLRIGGQVPLTRIAAFLAKLSGCLVVEFVPKADPMAAVLLAGREDSFEDWTLDGLLEAFGRYFRLEQAARVPGTERTLCVFKRHRAPAG